MKTILYSIATLLLGLPLFTSCSSGLSESEAKDIALATPLFNEAHYIILSTDNHFTASEDSKNFSKGSRIESKKRDLADYHLFSEIISSPTYLTVCDSHGYRIVYPTSFLYLYCTGCSYCYDKFASKGLIKIEQQEENHNKLHGFHHTAISLTEEGRKYELKLEENPEIWYDLVDAPINANSGTSTAVLVAKKVYTDATKICESEGTAEFYFDYYYELTPFGEALFGPTQKDPTYRTKLTFSQTTDDTWKLASRKHGMNDTIEY